MLRYSPTRQLLLLAVLIAAIDAECPSAYSPWFDGSCFRVYSAVSFADAKRYCESDNAVLASIHSEQENEWITSLMGSSNAWIGLVCNETTRKLAWLDGTDVDYTALAIPNGVCNPSNGRVLQRADQKWYEFPNFENTYGLCKLRRKSNTRCGDFEELLGSSACIFYNPAFQGTWNSAEKQCADMNAHLLSIHDKEMNDAILAHAASLGLRDGIHIGLQSNATLNQLVWTDGSPVDYREFIQGFPNDIFGHCTVLETSDHGGQWMSNQCASSILPFICSKPANDLTTTQAPPTCPENPYFLTSGEVFSPSYPIGYPANLSCEYFLAATDGMRVELSFVDFETNACCDVLDIYDGALGTDLIYSLKGSNGLQGYKVKTKSSNVMRLRWLPTNGVGVRGWHVTFRSI